MESATTSERRPATLRLVRAALHGPRLSFDQFRAERRIREIDGLRAVAILFVIAGHMRDPMWGNVPGTGVPIFFVNSGFLITLLLLREHSERSRIDWESFYVRRAFRLLPVYFFALFMFSGLVMAGFAENPGRWWQRFVYFLTFQNEFASGATFGHTWTLAVQEKFYLAWPLVAFALIAPVFERARLCFAVSLAAAMTAAWIIWPSNYSVVFIPLVLGCILALLMFKARSYRLVTQLARPGVFLLLLVGAILVKALIEVPGTVEVPFSYAVVLLMPGLIVGPRWVSRILRSRPLVALGTWAYSMYLLHPLVRSAVDIVISPGQSVIPLEILRYALVVAGTAAFSFVTYRLIEKPCIGIGARFTERRAAERSVEKAEKVMVTP
ncbi:acyltransferase [Mycobacterium sp. TNTM28]|uniref:Acyltransferase n=1 Tax=[Mycobacterium] fortunisiensis TaxID=2600579 RepID=A0ABS6KHY6_9MYCO|nr:acyltransferase [[Mycobacterium] fortunisiensis]MBU9763165.1 acyltransferase [[Mycobacterium] fortunisiensis]